MEEKRKEIILQAAVIMQTGMTVAGGQFCVCATGTGKEMITGPIVGGGECQLKESLIIPVFID